jgi:molybdopterin converting factor small subunit
VKIRIPTPLRSYTEQQKVVDASGSTVGAILDDLDRQFPGLRFRVVDEQGRIRTHMKVFVNEEAAHGLEDPVGTTDDVTIMQALSGG